MNKWNIKKAAAFLLAVLIAVSTSFDVQLMSFSVNKVEAAYNGEPTYIKNIGGIYYVIQEFKSSGTFIIPAGVTKVDITVVAGGHGGYPGTYTGRWAQAGIGGSGGQVNNLFNYNVGSQTSLNITVGEGGLSYAAGGSSIVKSGATTLVSAASVFHCWYESGGDPGAGGYGAEGDVEKARTYDGFKGLPGTAGVDGVVYGGGGGGGGIQIRVGSITYSKAGKAGGTGGGASGGGASSSGGNGAPNTGGGGGGGGARKTSVDEGYPGGKGGSGIVIIRWLNAAPTITVTTPSPNGTFGVRDTAIVPQISVSDPDNNALTCQYYIDGVAGEPKPVAGNTVTPQTVSFNAVDMAALSEGTHSMRFTVSDGYLTTEATVSFTVDKNPPSVSEPSVSSTANSITMTGSASDAAGLAPEPYNFTVTDGTNTWQSGWKAENTYTQGSLQPNRNYTIKLEARDKVGNTAQSTITAYTQAQVPEVTASNVRTTTMDIVVSDSNPAGTEYQIVAGTKYIDQDGELTDTAEWITLTNKRIRVTGLTPNTNYEISAKAKNGAGEETSSGTAVSATTLPTAPENITAEPDKYFITLTWSAMPNILEYEVSADGITKSTGTETIYIDEDLLPNTQHSYEVRAVNAGGNGEWSDTLTVSTLPDPPGIPANLSAEASQNEITLTWDAVEGAINYDVEADGELKEGITGTTYTHIELAPNTPHIYKVRARNRGGTGEWSDILNKDTLPEPPGIPEGIQVTGTTKDTITLSWNAADRAEGYEIKVNEAIIGSTTDNAYTHTGLTADTEYTYSIRAKNRGGESGWTPDLTTRTLPEKPSIPNNLTATAGTKEITISWDNAERAAEYDVEADGAIIATITGTSYIHEGLDPDTQHSYRVKARNAGGESDYSTMVTAYTLSETTGMALTNVAAVVTNTGITLMWDAVAADTEYDVEVDGETKDNGKNTTYIHSGLQPLTAHTYKIRPKRGEELGPWCAVLAISTLPNPPDAPGNITAIVTNTTIQLMWDREEGATSYDIEIDGDKVESTTETMYIHRDLIPGTQHSYRIRAVNITGATPWSEAIVKSTIKPTYMIEAEAGGEYHIALTAMGMQEFKGRKIVLKYNSGEVEIEDLREETKAIELESGKIPGTSISINHTSGRIELEIDKTVEPGKAWTGVMDTVLIRSKVDGQISLDYSVE